MLYSKLLKKNGRVYCIYIRFQSSLLVESRNPSIYSTSRYVEQHVAIRNYYALCFKCKRIEAASWSSERPGEAKPPRGAIAAEACF